MPPDTHFDKLADWFESEIYGSSKGYIRLNVLWRDLLAALPELEKGGLSVLDAGGGLGQVSQRLAQLGHQITLAEPSQEMLGRASEAFAEASLSERVTFVHSDIQSLSATQYDLVLNHAVLEWVAEPKNVLGKLLTLVKPGRYLSLLFYNRNAAVFKRIVEAKFAVARDVLADKRIGDAQPLDPNSVSEWLKSAHFSIQSRSGIRMFHDHILADLRTPESLKELLELEFDLRQTEPFASLAQHLHLMARAA